MSRPLDPRLLREIPSLRKFLGLTGVLSVLSAVAVVGQAAVLGSTIVTVFSHHEFGASLLGRLVLLAALGLARAGIGAVQEYVSARSSVRVRAQLREATLRAAIRLGPAWAQRQSSGRLANASGPGLDALDGYLTRALPAVIAASVTPGIVLTVITVIDWQSGVLLLVMLPLVPLFMALVGVSTKRRVERQYLLLSRLSGHFLDLLRGLTTLRIYGQAQRQERTLREATEQYRRQTMGALRVAFLSALVLDLVAALSVAVVAVGVGLRLDSGHLAFGPALVVLLLAPELFAPLRTLGVQYHAAQEGTTAAAAALDIIDEAPASLGMDAPVPVRADGTAVFDGVSVAYPGRDEPSLDTVFLSLRPGALVVLEGESGAGKSTVIAALLGFVAPSGGQLAVGVAGELTDLGCVDAGSWRDNLAWLPQRPIPSQARVGDEVRLGEPTVSSGEVERALRDCRAPASATLLGEDGRFVSAGQRRRIALARVLVRARAVQRLGATPIVLLDEPSEDLDRETELVVASVIRGLGGWATVVVATHSPVLAALAERRIMLARGRVVGIVRQTPSESPALGLAVVVPAPSEPAAPASPGDRLRISDLARDAGVRGRLITAAVLSALAGLTGLGLTASSVWLISRAAQHPNVQALSIAVVGVRAFAISRALLRYGERLAAHDAALRLLSGLRARVFGALSPLGGRADAGFGRGDLLRRFVGDVDGVQDGLVRSFVPLAGALVTALGAVTLAAVLVPSAAVILAVALAVSGIAAPLLAARLAGDSARIVSLAGERDAGSAAVADSLPELVAYGAAERAVAAVSELDRAFIRSSRRPAVVAAGGGLLATGVAALTLPAVLWAGADAVRSGQLGAVTLGVLAVCVLVGFDAIGPLPAAFVAWARCRAGLQRVAEVLATRAPVPEPDAGLHPPTTDVGVLAEALVLSPAPGAPVVLDGADLRVEAGRRVAVIGPSGCGKSTLLAAVLRLLPPRAGSIDLTGDGRRVALSGLAADEVPPLVSGSLQGDHVFDATLRDNLRFVRPAASDAELDVVARRAGLFAFVSGLPAGWSTPAGPDGANLSGGERQRLVLARALLADPRVLVLDEPTAHLDAITEEAVLADLLSATAGRTVLMSTHRHLRPGAVDSVLRMAGGQLVDAEDCVALTPLV
jgi:ATP-binding cassette subfamily C protein CydCD